jgi:hypothetical protein
MKPKKTPSDYGQFYFRIDKDIKIQIENLISEILKMQKPKEKKSNITYLQPKRNAVILKALIYGLNAYKKTLEKKNKDS